MKLLHSILIICFMTACKDFKETTQSLNSFEKLLPDTTKSWLAKNHYRNYYVPTRQIASKLDLTSLDNGVDNLEIRLWVLSGTFDPQVIFLLRQKNEQDWQLRVIQYEAFKKDSVQADYSVQLSDSLVKRFKLNQFWNIPSQSEMKDGNKFGCMDGFVTIFEMADKSRYKYACHVCPDINATKDSTFYRINLLLNQVDEASVQHW